MKKYFKKAHLWMALPFGIFIFIMFLTGGLLVFQDELQRLFHPARYYVDEVKEDVLPLEKLLPIVHETRPQSELESVEILVDQPERTYHVDFETEKYTSIQVDPYTGKVKAVIFPGEADNDGFFQFIYELHTSFLIKGSRDGFRWGRFITGIITLMLFLIAVTGIVVWAPKKIKNMKERLKVNTKKGGFRFWYDLHLAGGILAAIFFLVITVTGLDLSFNWWHNGLYALLGATEAPRAAQPAEPAAQSKAQQERLSVGNIEDLKIIGRTCDGLVPQIKRDYPGVTNIKFKFGGGVCYISKNHNITRTAIRFDTRTGEIASALPIGQWTPAKRWEWLLGKIHTGEIANTPTKILYLLACIIGLVLPVTGYYFYFRKRVKKSKK